VLRAARKEFLIIVNFQGDIATAEGLRFCDFQACVEVSSAWCRVNVELLEL